MHFTAATVPRLRPTSLLGGSDRAREVPPGEVALPVTFRRIRQGWKGGFEGLSVSVATLAAVAAIAATYLVLHCALYLANARTDRAALRFLSGAEGTANKDHGEPCGALVGNPAAPVAADSAEEGEGKALVKPEAEEEYLVEQDVLRRVSTYAVELARFIRSAEPLLRRLKTKLRAKCVAALLRLSLMEFAAVFTLLERKERAGMNETISEISSRLWDVRASLGSRGISRPQRRHFKCLYDFLGRITEVEPVAAKLAVRQRLLRIEHLLQLQDVALGQLDAGLFWLRASMKRLEKAKADAKAAAAAAQSTGAAHSDAAEASVAAPAELVPTAAARVAAVVEAIEMTVRKRREQVLVDPVISHWLREVHVESLHYGIISRGRLEEITLRPLQTQQELLEDLQSTPLGSGDDPGEKLRLVYGDARGGTASSSVPKAPCRKDKLSPSEKPSRVVRVLRPPKLLEQGSGKKASATGSAPVPARHNKPAASAATADAPESSSLSMPGAVGQVPVFHLPSSTLWASVAAPRSLPASASALPSPAASAPAPDGFDRAPGASRPRRGSLFPSFFGLHATYNSPAYDVSTEGPLQGIGADGNAFREAGKFMSVSSTPLLQAAPSEPFRQSSWRLAESRPSSAGTTEGGPVNIFGWPLTFAMLGVPEGGRYRPDGGFLINQTPAKPSPAEIAKGFEQLAKLFGGASNQQPSETMQRKTPPAAGAAHVPDSAASAPAAAESSPTLTNPDEESISHWESLFEWKFGPFSPF
ncbi:uncharacterized protein EMH_0011570 [Eimeria mitis]|uniref:Transmembrane protein n=1 Tax=Eimeria mitis TaxID=44415 RepID=U6JR59_9EIME|nr:uncharacterized protein EMH_0011570 [Eimeria mitis]CDJ27919.1 hypothetical protein, conserved [Eimeria mitis]